jgi:hypothetical protein
MPKYKIRVLLVFCGDCDSIVKRLGLSTSGTNVLNVTEEEIKGRPAFKRMQLLPNADVVVDDIAQALGAISVASIGQEFKRGCDIVSPYMSESLEMDCQFKPPPASFF